MDGAELDSAPGPRRASPGDLATVAEPQFPQSPPPSPPDEPRPLASVLTGLALTALAWCLSRAVVGLSWGPARTPFEFNPYLWARFDSINYLGIAEHDRTFGRCGGPGQPLSGLARLSHDQWCGTAGWLPGFPWLVRVGGALGFSLPDAGLAISWLAMALALFLVWWGWGRDLHPLRALVLLLLIGLFPGAVYNFAFFPTSLALAGTVGAILAASRERFFVAALCMTLAGLCYPSAWFAAVGLAVGMVAVAWPLGAGVMVRRGFWGAAGLASLLVLGLHDQIAFARADAFFVMDAAPGLRAKGFPGEDFLRLVFTHHTDEQRHLGRFGAGVLAAQGVLAVALTAAAAVLGIRHRRERDGTAGLYAALVGVAVVVGIMVDSATGGAWNRSVVLAAPVVVCFRRLPAPVLVIVLVAVGATTALMSRFFFNGTLI